MSKAFQQASADYLLARQRMNEKVNECKEVEVKMAKMMHQIQDAYAARGDQVKTVGTLTVTVESTEGDVAENSVIKVFVEPESHPDFEEITEESEKKNQIAWASSENFPATFVFDAILQREAVLHLTVGEDDEEKEPIKEFTLPIAALFRENLEAHLNVVTGDIEAIKPVVVIEETKEVETPSTTTTETIFGATPAKEDEESKQEEAVEKSAEDSETFHDAVNAKDGSTAEKETTEEAKEITEVEAKEKDAEVKNEVEMADEAESKEENTTEEDTKKEVVVDETTQEKSTDESTVETVAEVAPANVRIHIKAAFELSTIEALAQEAVALSKLKADLDVDIRLCDQELSSARIRYERLKASQKPASATAGAAGGLLAGMKNKTQLNRLPTKPQTLYERTTSAISSTFTPQRRQLAWSFAFFVVVSAVFHTNGDDLLI